VSYDLDLKPGARSTIRFSSKNRLRPKVNPPPSAFDLSSLSRLLGGVRDLIVCTLFIDVLSLAMPLSLGQIYDRIMPNSAEGALMLLGAGIGSALIVEAVLRQVRNYVSGRMGAVRAFGQLHGHRALDQRQSR